MRVGRNLKGMPFAPGISLEQRALVEEKVTEVLKLFSGKLSGEYFPFNKLGK